MTKQTINQELQGIGVSGSAVTLLGSLLFGNKKVCVQLVSFTNETNDAAIAHVGVQVGSDVRWLKSVTITTATLYYVFADTVHVQEPKRVIVKFTNTTTGDILKANVFGYCE